jgi:hypothetical protein
MWRASTDLIVFIQESAGRPASALRRCGEKTNPPVVTVRFKSTLFAWAGVNASGRPAHRIRRRAAVAGRDLERGTRDRAVGGTPSRACGAARDGDLDRSGACSTRLTRDG